MHRSKLLTLLITLFSLVSCATNAGTGAMAGGAVGMGAGALVSSSNAIIGTAVGIVSGGLVGYALDEQDRRAVERTSPRTIDRMDRGEPLTINDVIKLSQTGVDDDAIIRYLKDTQSSYSLSQAQIRRLQDAGVSQRVINYMIDSGR